MSISRSLKQLIDIEFSWIVLLLRLLTIYWFYILIFDFFLFINLERLSKDSNRSWERFMKRYENNQLLINKILYYIRIIFEFWNTIFKSFDNCFQSIIILKEISRKISIKNSKNCKDLYKFVNKWSINSNWL